MTATVLGTGPRVAREVAAGLLRASGVGVGADGGEGVRGDGDGDGGGDEPLEVAGGLACRIGWAGPLDLALDSEADVQAACGVMHVHGRRYGEPTPLRVDFASVAAGVLAATGVLAALRARRLGAAYREVGVSVAQAALLGLSQYLAAASAPEQGCAEPDGAGGPPFVSADGVWFELEALEADGWLRFWSRLGVERRVVGRGWLPFQARYGTAACPLPEELAAAARTFGYRRLARVAAECGVGLTVAARRPTVLGGMPWLLRAGAPGGGRDVRAGGVPAGVPAGGVRTGAPGRSGGRGGLGFAGGPLSGVTVVEIARRVQGPLAGRVLALLGATVLRVEPPGGDPLRGVPPMVAADGGRRAERRRARAAGDGTAGGGTAGGGAAGGGAAVSARFAALNRGKGVLEADLRSAAGRSAVRELLGGADVLLHSLAPAKVAGLGLDAGTVAALRPGLVYAQASGGGPGLSTDYPVQAHSGLAALLAPAGMPPRPTLLTVCDVLGGLVCAAGTVAALEARERTGRAQRVESSLLSAARLLCGAAGGAGTPGGGVEVCTDLGVLVRDPRLAAALEFGPDGCAFVRAPWGFGA
ncbi:CoA transferase [Kitasatospora sp. NA04385]|uniref:CoA transferase n=1 Tax=Kitasatospora sp. NA04385 TaxID=2742135 RepID=UPI00159223FF|nr:CoA transferase [Kitasatospora sp. NA04385]QKW18759.1 CoA transferase [Kitasatospora sp. NA04385]